MYNVEWDKETGGILLLDSRNEGVYGEVRPVFYEELNLLGFNKHWDYLKCDAPFLWATPGRRYYYRGELVAEAKGGGVFKPPEIVFHEKDLELKPIAVSEMLEKNAPLLEGIIQKSLESIVKIKKRYRKKADMTAVAFSGGKDSLVLLDLVQRALPPDEFVVVFSDTTMEISPTYEAVEKAKKRWSHLNFETARSVMDAQTTWREFGPPSRIHRWCCTVHKSAPTLLKLKEIAGKPSVKALVYEGIRREESQARSTYSLVTEKGKHDTQINTSPLLDWSSAEVFLYLFGRDILLNDAYRYGLVRVGCAICPFSSKWTNSISWMKFKKDIDKFLNILREYAGKTMIDENEIEKFIGEKGWKGRAGGRDMEKGGNKVLENDEGNAVTFSIRNIKEDWFEWIKSMGFIVREGNDKGRIEIGEYDYPFQVIRHGISFEVCIRNINKADRYFKYRLGAVANKAAYCIHCRSCEVECPTGALRISEKVNINEEACIHCGNCISFTEKGCLVAKSLAVTKGGTSVKGLNRYQQFGMRKEWLEEYFQDSENWWHKNSLGNRQFDAMRVWLKEAEIVNENKITLLGTRLAEFGADTPLTWAIIWNNLVKNSALIDWYVKTVPWGSTYSKGDLINLIGQELAERTRKNAIDSLLGLLKHTPLGNDLGLGVPEIRGKQVVNVNKQGWEDIHPIAVLYSLYRYAEKIGRYDLSLNELFEGTTEGPYMLFGTSKDNLANILRGISSRFESWISVELIKDLDNIYLDKSRTALEVLYLE